MTELDQKRLEAEILNIQAQTAKAQAEAAKLELEKKNLTGSWRDFTIEAVKVASAVILGLGGITAAITGYQLSEVRKEKAELEITKDTQQLRELDLQRKSAQEDLKTINSQLDGLRVDLEAAKKKSVGNNA